MDMVHVEDLAPNYIGSKSFMDSYLDRLKVPSSPRTPTSVLPDFSNMKTGEDCSIVKAIKKLSPMDVKRLSIHMYPHVARQVTNTFNHMEEQKRDSEVIKDYVVLVDNGELNPDGVVRVKMEALQPPMVPTTPPPMVRRSNMITSVSPSSPESGSSSTKTPPPPPMSKSHLGTPQPPLSPPPALRSSLCIVIPHQRPLPPPPVTTSNVIKSLPPSPPSPPLLISNSTKMLVPPPPYPPSSMSATRVVTLRQPPPPPPPPPMSATRVVAPQPLVELSPPPPTSGKLGPLPPPPAPMTPRSIPPPSPPLAPMTPGSIPSPPPMTLRSIPPPPPPAPMTPGSIPPPPPPAPMTPRSIPPPPPMTPRSIPPPPPPAPMMPRNIPPPPPPAPMTPRSIPPPPPPLQQGKEGAPPPPPAIGPTRSLRAKPTTKLKRSSQMGSLYRLLKGKLEGSNLDGKSLKRASSKIGAASNGNGKQGMADALAEMTKRSSYFIQIEEDVKNYANSIKEVKAALTSFQTTDMDELIKFHKYVESHMEKLSDETQVLARFEDFPGKKLEGLRMAAALYAKLDAIATNLRNWKIESPVNQVIDKVENYFNKIKGELDTLDRTKDDELKKFKSQNIHFDFTILVRIKELMVEVSSNCMELALKETREPIAKEHQNNGLKYHSKKIGSGKILWRAFQFAFRVYTFAGGQDDRADFLTRELAQEIQTDPRD